MNSKNVLVTGGLGLLGSSIAENLLKKGHEVTIIDDFSAYDSVSSWKAKSFFGSDVEILRYDTSNSKLMDQFKGSKFDYIFNFGSFSSDRYFERSDENAINKTIIGMLNILKIARDMGNVPVIYPSSGTVYGNISPPQREEQPLNPQTLYSITKIYLEMLSRLFKETKSIGMRIFTGYGAKEVLKGNIASVVTQFTLAGLKGEKIEVYGDGNQRRDFINSDDVAEIAVRLAESDLETFVVNCGSGTSYSFNELLELISKRVENELKIEYVENKTRFVAETRADITNLVKATGFKPSGLKARFDSYFEKIVELSS